MYSLARLADELHVAQHRLVVAKLEVGPYPALGLAGGVEFGGGRRGEGAARDVGDETGAEEDGEDAEVLGVVVDGYFLVTRAEGVLEPGAEVVREGHVLCLFVFT